MSDSQNAAASPAPAPKRTVLTVLLYILLIAVIIALLWAMSIMNKAKDNQLIQDAAATYENLVKDMETLTQSQIEQQAEHVSVEDLLASPETVKGRYVVVDGQVQGEESTMVNQNMQAANMVVENFRGDTKGYILGDGVVAVDISGEPGDQLGGGDFARCFGAVFVVNISDIWTLPIVGEDLKKEFGDIEGTADKVVFVLSKGINKITAEEAAVSDGQPPVDPEEMAVTGDGAGDNPCAAPPADGATPEEGMAPPTEGDAPPADGDAPPAEPETPPTDGDAGHGDAGDAGGH